MLIDDREKGALFILIGSYVIGLMSEGDEPEDVPHQAVHLAYRTLIALDQLREEMREDAAPRAEGDDELAMDKPPPLEGDAWREQRRAKPKDEE